MGKAGLGALLSTSILVVAAPGWAQAPLPSGANSAAGESGSQLEDIVVTAQRRAENIQNVPISITAVTSSALTQRGINNTDTLSAAIPNLVINRALTNSAPYLRGVGTQSTIPGNENAVATYVDGVYIVAPSAVNFQFNNIERVEVLRGPQGTLYGRNSTGGLINVVTRTPQVDPLMEGRLSYGSYDTVEGNLYVTGGSGTVAADLALYGIYQGKSFGRYIFIPGAPRGDYENKVAVRGKIRWEPTERTSLTVSADYTRIYSDYGLDRGLILGFPGIGGVRNTGSFYDNTSGTKGDALDSDIWGISAKLEQELGFGTLTVLSAYRLADWHILTDSDAVPARQIDLEQFIPTNSYQNEAYISGESGRLKYVGGVFVFSSVAKIDPYRFFSPLVPAVNVDRFGRQKTTSYAAYLQGTYGLTDRTNLTLGIRYTRDKQDFAGRFVATAGNAAPVGTVTLRGAGVVVKKKPTWRIALDHHFTDEVMVYASYNRGFKSGTFNLATPNAPPVNPEKLDAYEIGFKGDLFDRVLRVGVSAFYYDYKDIQLGSSRLGISSNYNASSSKLKGLEFESTLAPRIDTGRLEFTANFSLLDGNYGNFPNAQINTVSPTAGTTVAIGDASGNRTIRSPKFTANLGASYFVPVGTRELGLTVNYYHNAGFFWDPDNRFKEPSYNLLSAEASLALNPERSLVLSIWGRNLLDDQYHLYVIPSSGYSGFGGPPRTVGGSLSFKL